MPVEPRGNGLEGKTSMEQGKSATTSLNFDFYLDEKDYSRFLHAIMISRNDKTLWFYLIGYFVLSSSYFWIEFPKFFLNTSYPKVADILLLALPFFAFSLPYLQKSRLLSQIKKAPGALGKTTWEIETSYLVITNSFYTIQIEWDKFRQIIENPDFYFMEIKEYPNHYYFLPKRVIFDTSTQEEFRIKIEKRIGKITQLLANSGQRFAKFALGILFLMNLFLFVSSNFYFFLNVVKFIFRGN
jgi:hypothetical protein